MGFWETWYFQLPNYALALLMYTVLGRLLLGLMVPADWDNYIWRAFVRLTDPVATMTQWVTPHIVPLPLIFTLALVWIMVLRVGLYFVFVSAGLIPPLMPPPGAPV